MHSQDAAEIFQLIGTTADGSRWTVAIDADPFVIGRKEGCHLRLAVDGISRVHAEMRRCGSAWLLVDRNSTNGTFVNRRRLTEEHRLQRGDVLQFGSLAFTVTTCNNDDTERTQIVNPHAARFERMMQERAVSALFQPIVRFRGGDIFGYEALGRGALEGLPESPGHLFGIARRMDREVELSLLFREAALLQAARSQLPGTLFFNILPGELDLPVLGPSLLLMREQYPALRLILELPETAVTSTAQLFELRRILADLAIGLAYDDFGAGQARLLELLTVPPDVIKFDIGLIHDIDKRPETARAILAAWVKMAQGAGIMTLAEGVETAEEAATCKAFGFDLAQGYYFGRPVRLAPAEAATDYLLKGAA